MNRKNKRRIKGKIAVLIVLLISAVAVYRSFLSKSPDNSVGMLNNYIAGAEQIVHDNATKECSNIYSAHMILLNVNNSRIICEKASTEKTYPASLTKMMTAIVSIENIPDLDQEITLSDKIFTGLNGTDASTAGFLPNERVKAIDLLYGTLLPSGAEAASGLADFAAGSEKKFVRLMNQKAKKLGMKHTNFTNISGLYDPNHYTTVKDIAVLLDYALKNKTFYDVFTSKMHSVAPTNKHGQGITFRSTMFQSIKSSAISGGKIIGGKTGYTKEAGLCLASLAEKNGEKYILVTTGAEGNHDTKQYNILDAFNIYNKYLPSIDNVQHASR